MYCVAKIHYSSDLSLQFKSIDFVLMDNHQKLEIIEKFMNVKHNKFSCKFSFMVGYLILSSLLYIWPIICVLLFCK